MRCYMAPQAPVKSLWVVLCGLYGVRCMVLLRSDVRTHADPDVSQSKGIALSAVHCAALGVALLAGHPSSCGFVLAFAADVLMHVLR